MIRTSVTLLMYKHNISCQASEIYALREVLLGLAVNRIEGDVSAGDFRFL